MTEDFIVIGASENAFEGKWWVSGKKKAENTHFWEVSDRNTWATKTKTDLRSVGQVMYICFMSE